MFLLGPPGDSQAEGVAFNFYHAPDDASSVCVAGGVYQGTYSRSISWSQTHDGDGMLAFLAAPDTILDGVRADNIAQDAPSLSQNAVDFTVSEPRPRPWLHDHGEERRRSRTGAA